MALWMNRAGSRGEFESAFLDDECIYLGWTELDHDLSLIDDRSEFRKMLHETYPDAPNGRISSFLGQIWSFVHGMQIGDWVGVPSKIKRVIHFGEILGPYEFGKDEDPRFRHWRGVKWFATDIPRSSISQDILYSFGPQTICGIDAEDRIRSMASNGWKPEGTILRSQPKSENEVGDESTIPQAVIDLEASARDEIASLIARRFKGHGMAWLVEKVLQAKGYTTYRSPEGPDFGIDILAAPGPLGFGQPRIVVQVKSGESPIDRPTVDQLIGTIQNVRADQGLIVAWGGFKTSVDRETARQFFHVRLWDQQALIDQILENYEKLSEDLRAELPLKRIWTVAQPEDVGPEE